ncbi:MAG: hypothetical protein PHG02_00390 [Oscillospiraceae bacterium]|nr:hypothetical protein [Oscillospiraceae bacterium]
MQCTHCKLQLFVDHVEQKTTDNTQITTYFYVCKNPRCAKVNCVQTAAGQSGTRTLLDKAEQKEAQL